MLPLTSVLFVFLAHLGCGEDPVLKAAREEAEGRASGGAPAADAEPADASGYSPNGRRGHPIDGGAAGGAPGPGPGGEPGAEHQPGVPDEPAPGIPDEPPPQDADAPQGEVSARAAPPIEGPTATIKGSVTFPDYVGGGVRIDIFDGDQLAFGGERPSIVAMVNLDGPGPFEVEVPASVGRIWLSAFNDEDTDGRPGPLDPTGYHPDNPVSFDAEETITGVNIPLERRDPPGSGGGDVGL